jgi:dTDP-4-amino-4,6-dideoxygalactose transaminase
MAVIRYGGVIAGQEEIDAVTKVLQGQQWSAGKVTTEFENRFANYVGTQHAIAVNSGSSALLLALATLEPFKKVIIPALQFPTLYSACVWAKQESIIMDIHPDSLNLDADKLEAWLKEGNRADVVAFVHVAGNPAGIVKIAELCRTYDMILLEDCCEALGSTSQGQMAGSFGDFAAFSTHSAHHISTGEGGMLLTSDPQRAQHVRELRDWGRDIGKGYDKYQFIHTGFNLRPTDIGAALGLVQMDRLEDFNKSRRRNHAYLAEQFTRLGCKVPVAAAGDNPAWYTMPLLTGKRYTLEVALEDAQVETRRLLCGNLVRMPIANHKGYAERFPVAEDAWKNGLWVPVHPSVSEDDLKVIVDAAAVVFP